MSTLNKSKINKLLMSQPHQAVFVSSWLADQGYNASLQKRYRSSEWLQSIGKGAMIRTGDDVGYEGALYALQHQLDLSIHPAGRTALSLLGRAHYLELAQTKVVLYAQPKELLPIWFKEYDWGITIDYHQSSFLPADVGMIDLELKTFTIKISSPARALMECLHLAPKQQDLMECVGLMEGMNNLLPNHVQELLQLCQSVKVKRLFLYIAEKINHEWVQYLNLEKINLGKGNRSFVNNGVYVPKYQITVPAELENFAKAAV